jgi:hypothetical protein
MVRHIKQKLNDNNVATTQAESGNSIIITYKTTYQEKVLDFINLYPFKLSNTEQTHTFQKEIRKSMNNSKMHKKLINNNSKITTANKGNSIIRIYKPKYLGKLFHLISSNILNVCNTAQTDTFHKAVRISINNSNTYKTKTKRQ